jgi:hypothetical protein
VRLVQMQPARGVTSNIDNDMALCVMHLSTISRATEKSRRVTLLNASACSANASNKTLAWREGILLGERINVFVFRWDAYLIAHRITLFSLFRNFSTFS